MEHLEGADVVHDGGADGHERADDEGAGDGGDVELEIRLERAGCAFFELADLEVLAAEGLDHADLAEAFLGDGEEVALALLNRGRLAADAVGVEADGHDDEGEDGERAEGELPVHAEHDDEGGDKHDDRAKDGDEAAVVERLHALRVVGDAEARVRAAPGVVELQREGLEIGIEFRAELHEGLQADADEDEGGDEIDEAPGDADDDEGEAEVEGDGRGSGSGEPVCDEIARLLGRSRGLDREDAVDEKLERPGFQDVEENADERQGNAGGRGQKEGPEVAKRAKVD